LPYVSGGELTGGGCVLSGTLYRCRASILVVARQSRTGRE
jgi:hypothetical protein